MLTPTPLVCSVSLSWNRRRDTLECLRSILASDYPNVRATLVDNASTDGTVEAVRSELPAVATCVNPVNLGYAAGINIGLRRAVAQGADYAWIVDNDATVEPHTLARMLEVAEADPSAGLLTPKILFYSKPDVIWCAGHKRRRLTLAPIDGRLGVADASLNGAPRPMDYAPCCGLLIRRSVLEQVGLLDEHYFIYYEDLDFCLRAQQGGFQLLNVPAARVYHKVATSAGQDSPLQKYYLARSSVHFYTRHTRRLHRLLIVPYRLGSALRSVSRALFQRKPRVASAYLQGLRDGLAEVHRKADIPRQKGIR